MLKPFLISTVLATVMLSPQALAAARKYGMGGCGLGSIIYGSSPGGQSCAASTNNTFLNQMFGISSGTSNCQPSGKGMAGVDQEDYFVANFATLSKEAAQGSGEALQGFAGVLGCSADRTPVIAARLQADYHEIFAQPGAIAAYDAAMDSLRGEPQVVASCQYL